MPRVRWGHTDTGSKKQTGKTVSGQSQTQPNGGWDLPSRDKDGTWPAWWWKLRQENGGPGKVGALLPPNGDLCISSFSSPRPAPSCLKCWLVLGAKILRVR